MIRYLVYREDGTHQKIESEKPLNFKILQKIIGGYIEIVRLHLEGMPPLVVLVDEEGLLKNRKQNSPYPQFVGTVILTSEEALV